MKYNSFLFDFDGVIVDSIEIKAKAFGKLFESYGSEIKAKVVEHHLNNGGMSRSDKFKYYYEVFLKTPIKENEINKLCSDFSSIVVEQIVAAPEISGVEKFLKKVYKNSSCFIISATPSEEIGQKLCDELYDFILRDSKVPDAVIKGVGQFIDFRKYLRLAADKGAEEAIKQAKDSVQYALS